MLSISSSVYLAKRKWKKSGLILYVQVISEYKTPKKGILSLNIF